MASMRSASDLADIGNTVARGSKKMKDGAVVPHVVCGERQFHSSNIGSKLIYTVRSCPEAFPICVNGGLCNVEDSDVFVSARKEIINQGGFTATNIDDGSRAIRSRLF